VPSPFLSSLRRDSPFPLLFFDLGSPFFSLGSSHKCQKILALSVLEMRLAGPFPLCFDKGERRFPLFPLAESVSEKCFLLPFFRSILYEAPPHPVSKSKPPPSLSFREKPSLLFSVAISGTFLVRSLPSRTFFDSKLLPLVEHHLPRLLFFL